MPEANIACFAGDVGKRAAAHKAMEIGVVGSRQWDAGALPFEDGRFDIAQLPDGFPAFPDKAAAHRGI